MPARIIVLLLLLVMGSRAAAAQSTQVLTDRTLETAGGVAELYAGWRFHPGDDPAFAEPDFDDSTWPTTSSTLQAGSPYVEQWPGVGWFRKRLVVDSTLSGQRWGVQLMPFGAAELYVDGELVHRTGQVSADPAQEVRVHSDGGGPIPLPGAGEHVLAVRYSNTRAEDYLRLWYFIGFELRLGPEALVLENAEKAKRHGLLAMFFFGLYAAFALVHAMLYLAYRASRENLYFSLMVTGFAGIVFLDLALPQFFDSADALLLFPALLPTCIVLASLAGMAFEYTVFYGRMLRVFYVALATGVVLTAWTWIAGMQAYSPYTAIFALLILAENVRVVLVALHQKKRGARLIGLGLAAITVGFAEPLLDSLGALPFNRLELFPYLTSTILLVSFSIYLSKSVAKTTRDLRRKLIQVEDLSREKLEQEQRTREEILQRKLLESEYRRKLRELEEARQLQLAMLPSAVPDHPELDIAAYMETAAEVGGDYYDFDLRDDGVLTLAVGDATGHGMRAGVMVTAMKSLFKALSREQDLLRIIRTSTRAIKAMNLRGLYMALIMARYDSGVLQLAAAGMPPVLVYRKATGCVETIRLTGMPLGSFVCFPYREARVALHPQDTVLFMSDGLPELFNREREMLGYERAASAFAEVADAAPEAIVEHLTTTAHRWAGGEGIGDDMTFVVIRRVA